LIQNLKPSLSTWDVLSTGEADYVGFLTEKVELGICDVTLKCPDPILK